MNLIAEQTFNSEVYTHEHLKAIQRVCFRYDIKNHEDQEDVTQSIMLKVWRIVQSGKFRGESTWKTYITRCAINECGDFYRRRLKRKEQAYQRVDMSEQMDTIPSSEPDVDECVHANIQVERVKEIVTELSEKTQEVFRMRFVLGMRENEIADGMAMNENTVGFHILKARRTIKEHLNV